MMAEHRDKAPEKAVGNGRGGLIGYVPQTSADRTAYRAGMMAAAVIAENTGLDGSAVLWGREMIRKAIIAEAEKI